MDIRLISAEQTYPLRRAVLRPNRQAGPVPFDGDDQPGTLHIAGYAPGRPDQTLGILTLMVDPMPGDAQPGDLRLRGMAVAHAVQGTGVGRRLVEQAIIEATTRGYKRLWCNARVSAIGFYRRLGFTAHGKEFDIPGIGPHDVMSIAVDDSAPPR